MKWKVIQKQITYENIMSYGFLAILGIFFLCSFYPDDAYSETENRTLRTFPEFQLHDMFDHQFQNQFAEYKNDQFAGRNNWVQIKTKTDIMLGKKKFNGVYLGRQDQLFEDFQPTVSVSEIADAINGFKEHNTELNMSFLLVPNPISIWQDRIPYQAPMMDQLSYMKQLQDALDTDIQWIDAYKVLNEHKEEYIYYRSDHHWTSLGAYYAFTAFAEANDMKVKAEDWNAVIISDSFYGSLAGKSGYTGYQADEIHAYLPIDASLQYVVQYIDQQQKSTSVYNSENLNEKDQYRVFLNGNHPIIEINTTSKIDKRLLVIKDSYANCMIPFLLPYYNKITIVDPRYYNEDIYAFLTHNQISDVLFLYNANTLFQDTSLSLLFQ